MFNLYSYKDELNSLIEIFNKTFELDMAIFDLEANLISSTNSYLQHKGMMVHGPSIQEVINEGNVIVNQPGHMESCIGCRFKDNCPSTVEILKSITLRHNTVGAMALTSFTKEGHDRIMSDLKKYSEITKNLSSIISALLSRSYIVPESQISRAALMAAIEISNDAYILTDSGGSIEIINTAALELFSFCGMNMKSLTQIFPDDVASIILSERTISNYRVKINGIGMFLFSSPIRESGLITGIAVRVAYKRQGDSQYAGSVGYLNSSVDLKGKSKHIRSLKEKINKIANSPSTVFISGETGTGKSMLAKAIHYGSRRRNKPFVMVNCTSIPESLFESELFGYESGAFTGAKKEGKPGKFELANGGTLFLDEVSEIPLSIQAKLLSVLQESTFERVGGISPLTVDVRIIAASNRNLQDMIREKNFRSDLFYRLNVIPIDLIPLRERREDISLLLSDFLKRYNDKLNRKLLGFDNDVMELFYRYNWPGNIRQLENVVEYCINMADKNVITQKDLPPDFMKDFHADAEDAQRLQGSEYEIIIDTINRYGWDVKGKTAAAARLGFGLRTLYRKLKEMERNGYDVDK